MMVKPRLLSCLMERICPRLLASPTRPSTLVRMGCLEAVSALCCKPHDASANIQQYDMVCHWEDAYAPTPWGAEGLLLLPPRFWASLDIFKCVGRFASYRGLYFWSLILASFGIIPYVVGFLIEYFQPAALIGLGIAIDWTGLVGH